MSSILIITQIYALGGLETYIRTQVNDLVCNGHRVHLICGKTSELYDLPDGLSSVHQDIVFEENCSIEKLVSLVDYIRGVIRDEDIDIVHVHPFACVFPAVIAAGCEEVTSLLTLHGPLSIQYFMRDIYKQTLTLYLFETLSYLLCVSNEVADTVSGLIDNNRIVIQPNLIDTNITVQSDLDLVLHKTWVMASRLDTDKLPGIIAFIDYAKSCIEIEHIDIYGAGSDEEKLKQYIEENALDSMIHLKGISDNIPALMSKYAGFAGMGRGVLEAAFSHIPVCLVGYDGVKGMLHNENFSNAAYCNFSGRNMPTISHDIFLGQINDYTLLDEKLLAPYRSSGKWERLISDLQKIKLRKSDSLRLYELLCNAQHEHAEESYLHSVAFIDAIFDIVANIDIVKNSPSSSKEQQLIRDVNNMTNLKGKSYSSLLTENESVDLQQKDSEDSDNGSLIISDLINKLDELERNFKSLDNNLSSVTGVINSMAEKQEQVISLLGPKENKVKTDYRYLMKTSIAAIHNPAKRYELIKTIYWKLPEKVRVKLGNKRSSFVQKNYKYSICTNETNMLTTEESPEWVIKVNNSTKIAIIPCAFEFEEMVNQRPINAAKHFAAQGYQVIFVAWQWKAQEELKKGCSEVWPNVYQVPLYDFCKWIRQCEIQGDESIYIVTMPAKILMPSIYSLRAMGVSIIYDIMDEWECFNTVGQAPWYQKDIEESIVLLSDYVCCVAPSLRDKFLNLREDISLIGNGYSVDVLGDTRNIAKRDSKKVGYFGHLTDAWFDWNVIFKLASNYPEYQFEIIGYGEPDWVLEKVKKFDNIFLIGKVMPQDLNKYVRGWALGLIPFKSGKLAEAVDPIKIYEYLYFGLPTLATGIEHIKQYPMTYFSDEDNIEAIFKEVISVESSQMELEQFLAETTWSARFEKMKKDTLQNKSARSFYVH